MVSGSPSIGGLLKFINKVIANLCVIYRFKVKILKGKYYESTVIYIDKLRKFAEIKLRYAKEIYYQKMNSRTDFKKK
jgi:hypothetical protein